MAAVVAERLMSAEEFLEWESAQLGKYELIDNRIFLMPGGSRTHEVVIAALVSWFYFALMDRVGDVYAGMQVKVDALATYTYPDVTVVCQEPRFHRGSQSGPLENPTLLFEVLSPSTEKIDRNQKLDQYLRIPSLRGYFLVSQDKPLIEAYARLGDDWTCSKCSGLESSLVIPALDSEIPLAFIYRKAQLAPDEMP